MGVRKSICDCWSDPVPGVPVIKRVKWIDRRRPQCQHRVDRTEISDHYRKYLEERLVRTGKSPDSCGKYATHEVDGVYLCAQHAGIIALEFMEQPKTKIVLTAKQR